MSPKYATVDIGQNGKWTTVWVTRREWQSIAFLDYIELNPDGSLSAEFADEQAYSLSERLAMQAIASKRLLPVVTENVIDTQEAP